MSAILHFFTLAITTMLAAAAAVFLDWLALQAAFRLMRPAAATGRLPKRCRNERGKSRVGRQRDGRPE